MGDYDTKLKYSHFLWELQGFRIININKTLQDRGNILWKICLKFLFFTGKCKNIENIWINLSCCNWIYGKNRILNSNPICWTARKLKQWSLKIGFKSASLVIASSWQQALQGIFQNFWFYSDIPDSYLQHSWTTLALDHFIGIIWIFKWTILILDQTSISLCKSVKLCKSAANNGDTEITIETC